MIKIYHNNRCSKSRAAVNFLKERNLAFDTIYYLDEKFSYSDLAHLLGLLQLKPFNLIRKGEAIYKEQFKGKVLSDEEWIQAMVDFPVLIERPIVVNNDKAVVARPEEKILEIL